MGINFKPVMGWFLTAMVFGIGACTEEEPRTLTPEEECTLFNLNCSVDCSTGCQVGTLACQQNTVQECVADPNGCGVWLDRQVCDTSCANGVCTALPCAVNCELGAKRCSGTAVQECVMGGDGCNTWNTLETCPKACSNGACAECPTVCTEGQKTCHGKTLKECKMINGCLNWSTVKTCGSYCVASKGICTDDLPSCDIKNGSYGKIDRWKDGDTVVINAYSPDDSCNERKWNEEYKYWQQIRYDIRIHGIDAPECNKRKVTLDSGSYYYECKKDTYYDNENEPYGYESWLGAKAIAPQNMIVTISCDEPYSDGTCPLDDTDERYLTYIGYSKNNASYDFSVETVRAGNAFSNTNFPSDKRADICRAQKEAQENRAGLWGTANSVDAVIQSMGSTKRKWLGKMTSRCNSAMY